MHGQPLEEARASGFTTPPPHKVAGPIVDMHTHMTEPASDRELVEAARTYRITRVVAIAPLEMGLKLQARFPEEIVIASRAFREPDTSEPYEVRTLRMIGEAAAHGVPIIKFWFAPRIRDRMDFLLDDPRLDPVFEAIAGHRLGVLVHVSDPDVWFERKYDPRKYGTKLASTRCWRPACGSFRRFRSSRRTWAATPSTSTIWRTC